MSTLREIIKPVENIVRKRFSRDIFAQIIHLFPEAYRLSVVQILDSIGAKKPQLRLEMMDETKLNTPLVLAAKQTQTQTLSNDRLLRRRDMFRARLFQFLRENQKEGESPVKVPTIPRAILPDQKSEKPKGRKKRVSLLEMARMSLPVKSQNDETTPIILKDLEDSSDDEIDLSKVDKEIRNTAPDLLRKIMERDRVKKRDEKRGGPEHRTLCLRLGRLPDVAKAVRSIFVSQRRSGMPLIQLQESLARNSHLGSKEDIQEELNLLLQRASEWASLMTFGVGKLERKVFRLSKKASYSSVLKKLTAIQKHARAHAGNVKVVV